MLFSYHRSRVLVLLLTTSMLALATLVLAAPSTQQRAAEVELRTLVKKAGDLYLAGDYEESGKVVADVQARFDKLVTSGDKEVIALLDGVFQSLKKAHQLLELEGVKLPPLKVPVFAKEKITPTTKLAEGNFSNVRDAILARPPKELWIDIPWRPNLAEAIGEAREKDKPILLWMMNGHPCGMT